MCMCLCAQALGNLAAIGNDEWANTIGDYFLGPALAALRLMDEDRHCQQAFGKGVWV